MKTQNYTTMFVKKGALVLLAVSMLTACKKDKDKGPDLAKPGKVAMLISSPGADEFSFLLNGTKTNTAKPLTYNTVIDYTDIKAGTGEFSFTKKGATEVLAKINYNIKPQSNYSLIVTDKSPKAALILVEDDLSAPAADKAKVRFINLSPDAPELDLYVGGKLDAGLTKKAFKAVSSFVNVDPGAELKFEIKENGKTEVLATLDKYKVEKGKIYTIWARGLKAATDATKLGVEAMANK